MGRAKGRAIPEPRNLSPDSLKVYGVVENALIFYSFTFIQRTNKPGRIYQLYMSTKIPYHLKLKLLF